MKYMHINRAATVVAIALVAAFTGADPARAEDGAFYGLLRMRDLTTFGFLRLDMRPAHAVSIDTGTWAAELDIGYQNTWATSPRVEDYLTSIESQGRHALGPADLQAIRALPGENYLLDLESGTVDAIVHYKFADNWSSYLIVSGVSYQGGFLDGTIEAFHRTFGFSDFGRPAVRRNDVNLIYDLKSAQVASLGTSPTNGGLLDPTLGVRYTGFRLPERWGLSVEAATKVPVDGTRELLSTGHFDYGLQASLQRRGDRYAIYADVAAVYYGGAAFPVPQSSKVIPTLILGYEYRLTARTNVNLQAYVSKSAYSHDSTDLPDLTGTKYEYSLGFRHRINRFLVTFGFTENVENINNTPDIGLQLGVAYVPHRTGQT